MPVIEDIKTIMTDNGGAIPTIFPLGDSSSSHITNTAFFLNALIPDDLKTLNPQYRNLLTLGIEKTSEMFNKKASSANRPAIKKSKSTIFYRSNPLPFMRR